MFKSIRLLSQLSIDASCVRCGGAVVVDRPILTSFGALARDGEHVSWVPTDRIGLGLAVAWQNARTTCQECGYRVCRSCAVVSAHRCSGDTTPGASVLGLRVLDGGAR